MTKCIYSRYAKLAQHLKTNQYNLLRQQPKKKNILSIDVEKTFNKIQSPFMIKTLSKLGIENFLNLIKNIYKTSSLGSVATNCNK